MRSIEKIKKYINNPVGCETELTSYIMQNIVNIPFEELLNQKIILKIYLSDKIDQRKKEEIYELITYNRSDYVKNYIHFIKEIFPVINRIQHKISHQIQEGFDSLFVFLVCVGMFAMDNPSIIGYPKKLLIKLATGVLPDDTAWSEAQGKIEIAESIYLCKEKLIESIYSEAIKCGCIAEKFDDISYLKEDVEKIEVIENRPEVQLRMKKPEYSYRIMLGSAYYGTVAAERMAVKDWKKDLIYQFYECYICKRCYFEEDGKILKSWMNGMLDRQFFGENMLDILLRHYEMKYTASVIVSILLYLYIEVLFLIMTQSGMYRTIHYKEIKKNICFGDKITDEEFLTVYNIVFKSSDFLSDFCEHLYFRVGENIIIAKWMFDEDYNVFEESRNIALNAKGSKILGEEVDFFGKNVFENVVKSITKGCGWEVLQSGLKVKKTDFDLVAYKDGKVILGQIKVAHCNRKPFQLWKAECIIRKAIEQINACRVAITEDDYLLFSNLKREKIVSKKNQIKEIFYVIIAGNSYFSKLGEVPVISIEDLKNILMIKKENALRFREVLKNPFNMYDIPQKPQYRWSLIEQEEYSILYNEFEI